MPYQTGDAVTVRNGSATWPGTVEEVREGPCGPRYSVRITRYTLADVGEAMLAPAEAEKEGEAQ